MKMIRNTIATICCLLAFAGSYWIASMLLDREPPIKYEQARALAPSVAQGGTIDVEYKVYRTRVCPVNAKRWLIDAAGERHAIPSYTVGVKQLAGRETYQRSITIPDATAIGRAEYEVDLLYACNLFHRLGWPIKVISPPIDFDVTPGNTAPDAPIAGDG